MAHHVSQTWAAAIAASQTASVTASPYQITGLANGAQYWVRVVAVNVAGSGPASPEATATPMAAPTITSVDVTSTPKATTDTYGLGEDIVVTVTFDEAVTVTGAVDFGYLNVSGAKYQARLLSGNGTTELVFAYTVQAGDTDTNGIFIGNHTSAYDHLQPPDGPVHRRRGVGRWTQCWNTSAAGSGFRPATR